MHGIYITAILTTGIAAAIFGPLIHKLKMPANERLLWLAAGIAPEDLDRVMEKTAPEINAAVRSWNWLG